MVIGLPSDTHRIVIICAIVLEVRHVVHGGQLASETVKSVHPNIYNPLCIFDEVLAYQITAVNSVHLVPHPDEIAVSIVVSLEEIVNLSVEKIVIFGIHLSTVVFGPRNGNTHRRIGKSSIVVTMVLAC